MQYFFFMDTVQTNAKIFPENSNVKKIQLVPVYDWMITQTTVTLSDIFNEKYNNIVTC